MGKRGYVAALDYIDWMNIRRGERSIKLTAVPLDINSAVIKQIFHEASEGPQGTVMKLV